MKRWLTVLLATTSLAGCGNAVSGSFCDVVKAPHSFAAVTAKAIVKTDRAEAERLKVENDYGAAHCGWPK